jgi:hypothetical protein
MIRGRSLLTRRGPFRKFALAVVLVPLFLLGLGIADMATHSAGTATLVVLATAGAFLAGRRSRRGRPRTSRRRARR